MTSYEEIMGVVNPRFPPTPEQRLVIESDASAILVVAGAGSGKTATMANRIAYHVAAGNVRPEEVLGLTFTRKAAGELAQRVEASLSALRRAGLMPCVEDPRSAENPAGLRSDLARASVATYNSFASEIAQTHGMLVGADPGARLVTDAERWQLMSRVVDDSEPGSEALAKLSRGRVVEVSLALAAGIIDNGVEVGEALAFFEAEAAALARLAADPRKFRGMREVSSDWSKIKGNDFDVQRACLPLVEAYFARKKDEGVVEFADQISIASAVVRSHPEIGREIASRYRLVLLDEYQDTSTNQAEFLREALAPDTRDAGGRSGTDPRSDSGADADGFVRSVCAVGDPNQAIYGWRGASSNALADFATRFGARLGPVRRLSLSTSFRSDRAILDAANAVASGLATEGVDVGRLAARPGAGPGMVAEVRTRLREDSYRAIAHRIRDVFADVAARGLSPEVAVLCRKRSYVDPMTEALRDLKIPYEIVGGESLVSRPEILTVRCALGVVCHPERNDLLLRLLTLWGIGAGDLRALHAWSGRLARLSVEDTTLDAGREASLVEALDEPTAEGFTERARVRLARVAAILRSLRGSSHLPLAELVGQCIALLGLDVAAAGTQRVKTSLDSFVSLGRDYEARHPGCGPTDFLDWLDLVEAHEHGGEGEAGLDEVPSDVEVHPGVVQIMTVHAAKGLEWRDLVAVPEMVDGQFSEVSSGAKSWLSDPSVFPFPLRGDARHLPGFRPSNHADKIEAAQAHRRFLREELPEHESQEARRLAYVAFTRPTRELLLAGYADKGRARSVFLEDIRRLVGVTSADELAGPDWPADLKVRARDVDSANRDEDGEAGVSPAVPDYSGHPRWPVDLVRSPTARGAVPEVGPRGEWARAAKLLIAERLESSARTVRERAYLTATDVVHLADDPQAFLRQQRRPIPRRPSRAARTGADLHARIAGFYERPATLDIDSVLGGTQQPVDQDVITREEEQRMFEAFRQSRWSRSTPIAVEESLSLVIAGRVVRCAIDAVLDTSGESDLADVTIVDWKTGRRPGARKLEARELQLAIYRLAWSKAHGLPTSAIGACFVYLREPPDRQVLETADLTEEQIAERIRNAQEEGWALSQIGRGQGQIERG